MDNNKLRISTYHQLPKLEDPDHPGVFLISRIVLFSIVLFIVLIAIGAYTTFNVSLDFELSFNGVVKRDHIVLYGDESKASVIEPGDKAQVFLNNGLEIEAEVIRIDTGNEKSASRYHILLKAKTQSSEISQYLQGNIGDPLSATVFTTSQTLWSFVKEKLDISL